MALHPRFAVSPIPSILRLMIACLVFRFAAGAIRAWLPSFIDVASCGQILTTYEGCSIRSWEGS